MNSRVPGTRTLILLTGSFCPCLRHQDQVSYSLKEERKWKTIALASVSVHKRKPLAHENSYHINSSHSQIIFITCTLDFYLEEVAGSQCQYGFRTATTKWIPSLDLCPFCFLLLSHGYFLFPPVLHSTSVTYKVNFKYFWLWFLMDRISAAHLSHLTILHTQHIAFRVSVLLFLLLDYTLNVFLLSAFRISHSVLYCPNFQCPSSNAPSLVKSSKSASVFLLSLHC